MSWRCTPFTVPVAPRIGSAVCGAMCGIGTHIRGDLLLSGILLDDGDGARHVIAVVDFCYACGRSQARLEEALARGAGVDPSAVVIQSNHIHAAPAVSEEIHATVSRFQPERRYHDADWFDDLLARCEAAVAQALAGSTDGGFDCAQVAFTSHPVYEFASSRRVPDGRGGMQVRWSFCQDPHVKHAPVGLIDPMLDLILLCDAGARPRAALSFYASHPQVGTIPGSFHGDSIGVARDLWRAAHPDIPLLHFDGCGGDITAGKYTARLTDRNLLVFGTRLYDALDEAFLKARPRPIRAMRWQDAPVACALAPVTQDSGDLEAALRDPTRNGGDLWLAAKKLNRIEGRIDTWPFRLTRWSIDADAALFLPSELVVEYQLHAKRVFRGNLAVAAYGDSFFDYVGTDHMFAEGGYEVEPMWTEVGPGIEGQICGAIDALLSN